VRLYVETEGITFKSLAVAKYKRRYFGMGKLTVLIDDEVEKEFRHLVLDKYSAKKGGISRAVEEALKLWIEKTKAELGK